MLIKTLLRTSLLCSTLFWCAVSTSFAGDPGPYRLAFLDISEEPYQDGQKMVIELRKMSSPSPDWKACFLCNADDDSNVGVIYLYSVPVGLSIEDVRKAVNGDSVAKRKMQTVLYKFADHQDMPIDGLLAYEHKEGVVNIYTMDRKIGSKLSVESKPIKTKLLHSSLDKMLESAAQKLKRDI